jgi:hypothetical protein
MPAFSRNVWKPLTAIRTPFSVKRCLEEGEVIKVLRDSAAQWRLHIEDKVPGAGPTDSFSAVLFRVWDQIKQLEKINMANLQTFIADLCWLCCTMKTKQKGLQTCSSLAIWNRTEKPRRLKGWTILKDWTGTANRWIFHLNSERQIDQSRRSKKITWYTVNLQSNKLDWSCGDLLSLALV